MSTQPEIRRKRKSLGAPLSAAKRTEEKENARRKGSRSKSIGPAALPKFQPRSILKPTVPVGHEMPDRSHTQPLIDLDFGENATFTGPDILRNHGADQANGAKIALRTEEEQQASAKEREERERREARRKSLANRRVSFAAEATLHTFHEIEYPQDSTASTNSTRRSSSAGSASTSHPPESDKAGSSENQQNRRRHSSGIQSSHWDQTNDDTLGSSLYGSSDMEDSVEEVEDHEDTDSSSESSDDDGTMVTVEGDEMTSASVASADDLTLDDALRLATQHAGTQQLGSDDEAETEEIIPSFGWARKDPQNQVPETEDHQEDGKDVLAEPTVEMDVDMDMTHAVGGIIKPSAEEMPSNEIDASMDVTKAFGIILGQERQLSINPADAIPLSLRADAPPEGSPLVSRVKCGTTPTTDADCFQDNEDMSMELTTVMGGVLAGAKTGAQKGRWTINRSDETLNTDEAMDLTTGVGGIIPQRIQRDEDEIEETMCMDMTVAVGKILPSDHHEDPTEELTMGMEMTTAIGSIIQRQTSTTGVLAQTTRQGPSPQTTLAPRALLALSPKPHQAMSRPSSATEATNRLRTSVGGQQPHHDAGSSAVARPSITLSSSRETFNSPVPPLEEAVCSLSKPSVPKTKLSPRKAPKEIALHHQTPERKPALDYKISPPKSTTLPTPRASRLSGVGADREGLGSPRVSALLDRRVSIGESSSDFAVSQASPKRRVVFEDPRVLEREINGEYLDDETQDDKHKTQDEKEITLNLKEMIASLSPKKNPVRGRKSLHVGSARGVLGKRPTELDDSDEENDGIKRLKGHQGSPVKNVRLQQPPSNAGPVTGRLLKSTPTGLELRAPAQISGQVCSPLRPNGNGKGLGRDSSTLQSLNPDEGVPHEAEALDTDPGDRIHLQDFLSMISVSFMELTTSRRRQTQAPTALRNTADDLSLERCVVAGACTVPILELYQHSCRELKKYISEGRRMVKEIEMETFQDNPPLFREYASASSDFKLLMDNQFKNGKTHARLLSKAMWYEWRMKLQHGLKEGLDKIEHGMNEDNTSLERQRELLDSILPGLIARHETLAKEHGNLEMYARELADCDPIELDSARMQLIQLESDIEEKKREIAELRGELEMAGSESAKLTSQKDQLLENIKDAEKVREECRGWTTKDVNIYKGRVDSVEREHGWTVTGISGTQVSMAYKREIELVFDVACFRTGQPNSRIDLWYIATKSDAAPCQTGVGRVYFLQLIRDHLRSIPQSRSGISSMLHTVRVAWDTATAIIDNINLINITFPTKVNKVSDTSIEVVSSLLVAEMETKVEVALSLTGAVTPEGVHLTIEPRVKLVYGESFNVGKIKDYLASRISRSSEAEKGDKELWSNVFVSLYGRLLARGRK
ncbi:hypothetical protein jhhlp_004474 [Lomentospora prolificans]|uniref:Spc7 kinetochore protein domain-containing protein n=1 Tax=Lomentospora prolificans TaxID=41688 RepID=A0A2N3NBQ8_9PEZI|nr:hypothetical protein jhhlp_004474 [Lomentospora prolificans]